MPIGADNLFDALYELVNPIIPLAADYAAQIPLPFARYVSLGENYEYTTRGAPSPLARDVVVHGEFQISFFASNREVARQLSRSVMSILDDAMLYYNDGRLMYINPISAIMIPEPRTAPGGPTVFHRAVTFRFNEQRRI